MGFTFLQVKYGIRSKDALPFWKPVKFDLQNQTKSI